MGYLSHRVDPDELKPGDHIYTWRTAFTYAHHGIYVGGRKVIHFTSDQENAMSNSGWNLSSSLPVPSSCLNSSSLNSPSLNSSCLNSIDCGFWLPNCDSGSCLCTYYCGFHQPESGVTFSCLNCFMGTGSLYLFQYRVKISEHVTKLRGGTSTTAPSDPPEVVIHRAIYLLNSETGFGKYDLVRNNCEDFALYCKTGLMIPIKHVSTGSSGQVNFIYNAPWMSALVSIALRVACGTVAGVVGGGYTVWKHYQNRRESDIGVRDDAVKVNVEDVGAFRRYYQACGM
ncbi:putative LRAT domain-containing protein [Helianthus annuus]|nr:putative LRAT domain-containing protein [Helianthus annuus]KAJ0602440.1 putative LRAT domain-containing protein [Helianthus annuus]KAJ0609311.1 putative LRAT domain-containing protein [Helianthus annuus]KAJ0769369.1 putative LRAT domain-containing protein [Helianthus annuus]KAJ0937230.1 putative LRAT domain-containing protein [Helianthus annuus]